MKTEKKSGPVVMEVRLDEIHESGRTQSRVALNQDAIDSYQEAMEESPKAYPFAPIVVFRERPGYKVWIGDGWHRYRAARAAGRKTISAEVRQGGERAAVLFAAGANKDHGVHRTPEDKRKAVGMLLADPEWARWSDREIARHCGVGHPLVASVRKASTGSASSCDTRKSADGKDRNVSNIASANTARPKPAPARPAPVRVVPEDSQEPPEDDEPVHQVDEEEAPAPAASLAPPAADPPRSFAADAQAVIDRMRAMPPEQVASYLADPSPTTAAARRNGAAAAAPALLDAEGKAVPAHLARAWELLVKGAKEVSDHLVAAQAAWTRLEHAATEHAKELAAGSNATGAALLARCEAAGLPVNDIHDLAARFDGLGTDTVKHLAYRVRELSPVTVCGGCEGKGGPAVHKVCCHLGWHSRIGTQRRKEKVERNGDNLDESIVGEAG